MGGWRAGSLTFSLLSLELEEKIKEFGIEIIILTLPKENAEEVTARLSACAIHGLWNFTGKELSLGESGIVVENVHIGDSLMTLCYEVAKKIENGKRKTDKN